MSDFLDHEGHRPHPAIVAPAATSPIITTLREHWSGLFPTLSCDQLVVEITPYVEHESWSQIWELALELLGYVAGTTQEHDAAWQVVAHAQREGWVQGGPTF